MSDFEKDITTATDIIDATQNAVIDAVTSVTEMIEKTTAESTFSKEQSKVAFYFEAEFWVGFSFVLVVVCLARPIFKVAKAWLEKRRDRIVSELEDAEKLRDDAQILLARYERQLVDIPSEVEAFLSQEREELDRFVKEQKKLFDETFEKKKKEAEQTIESSVEKTNGEMNKQIASITIDLVKAYLNQRLDEKSKSKLIDLSISEIVRKI